MHGPEHHFLIPAALITAYYNVKGDKAAKMQAIALAKQRSGIMCITTCVTSF